MILGGRHNGRSLQKRKKRPSPLGCAARLLLAAAAALSICTVVFSPVVIRREDERRGAGVPSVGVEPPRPPSPRDDAKNAESEAVVADLNTGDAADGTKSTKRAAPDEFGSPPEYGRNDDAANANDTKSTKRAAPDEFGSPPKYGRNDDYVPPPPAPAKRRLLTYRRFGGGLNNQLFQFVSSLQHARVLRRTLVVPNEVEDVAWTGMLDAGFDIWDLSSLNEHYDIDWRGGSVNDTKLASHIQYGLSKKFVETIPERCKLRPGEARALLNGGPEVWKGWDQKCPDIIDLDGSTGLLFCGGQHKFCGDEDAQMAAYEIYGHLRLSEKLMSYIPSRREEFKDGGYDAMAIHSRRAGEGGYDWELCINGNTKTCLGHVVEADQYYYCDARTMRGNCAAWSDLHYQIKSRKALRDDPKEYRFLLASDGTHDWNIDYEGQFVVADNSEWLAGLEGRVGNHADPGRMLDDASASFVARSKLKGRSDLARIRGRLDMLVGTLLDLFSLVDSEYFLGAYYSTLSLNACLLRGLDRIYDSNMCWILMHPTSRTAILPPQEESVNVNQNPRQDDPLPAVLNSDVEHAFVRSTDGNFIAIDRYIIGMGKRRNSVIAILGDGLLPITFMKNPAGEEAALADFTCSFGNQRDSPATVILMKGNKSYREHYHERGESYGTPFSSHDDRFRTMLVVCAQLKYDNSLRKHPPLILKSSRDGGELLRIGSAFQRTSGKPGGKGKSLVHCLGPVHGLKDPRWVIEYLEYHRAVGVSHVHVYNVDLHSPEVQDALQSFRHDDKFITRHDWSEKASHGYTTRDYHQHAVWAAQTDCALRSRGVFDYALFSDVEELALGGSGPGGWEGHLATALDTCEEAKNARGKIACSFDSNTVTSVYTKLNEAEETAAKGDLLLRRYTGIEARPHCPANCKCMGEACEKKDRRFHYGRQKYIANVKDLSIPPRPMWTHAISRDYEEMDEIMEVLPEEVIQVRRYRGDWYKNGNLLETVEEKEAPLPSSLTDVVRTSIKQSKGKTNQFSRRMIYEGAWRDASMPNGLEWIETVERTAKFHKAKTS